jgi:hypothetical protein
MRTRSRLLDRMMEWLRDVSLASAGAEQWITHQAHAAALSRQAGRVDVNRCVEAAFQLVTLRASLEQFANPKLVASLAREQWLKVIGDS